MSDPVGLIGASGATPNPFKAQAQRAAGNDGGGAPFAQYLKKSLDEVNGLQQDANRAVEDLVSGKRDDLEGVIIATEKADTAFRMLQQMRNKVMSAYEEIKQVRV